MPSRRPDYRRILWLAEEDLAAVRRLLLLLGNSDGPAEARHNQSAAEAGAESRSRRRMLERARVWLSLRQRRAAILGKGFSAEPPFEMLLALYVNEELEPDINASKLFELAWLAPTTGLRWLDQLASEGWVSREKVAADRRKAQIKLTEKARSALDELFSWRGVEDEAADRKF